MRTAEADALGLPSMAGFADGDDGLIHITSLMFGGTWCEEAEVAGEHWGDFDVKDPTDLCPACLTVAEEGDGDA